MGWLRYNSGPTHGDSLAAVCRNEAKLRPLITSVLTTASAAIWRAIADSGVMFMWSTIRTSTYPEVRQVAWEGGWQKPPRGDAAAAIKLLRNIRFHAYPKSAPRVLHGLASGQVNTGVARLLL